MNRITRCANILLAALVLCAGLLPGTLNANEAGETITFYHHDHLGTPIMATNEAGAVLWIREYSAYGDPTSQGAAETVGYAGHEYYPESNLTNMGARWYNSELGRFMSPDPVGFNAGNTLSFNRYLYGNNNPYTFYDPDGEYFDLAIEFVSIGFGISSAINNIKEGNFGSAALDVVGIAVDVTLAAVPGVPGGVGILRQGAKHADDVVGVANKTDRLKKHVLNGELDAARREAAGEVVARKADGTPWDHVTELRDAQRGLLKRIKSIDKQLGSNNIDDATRSSLQKELGEASRLLDKTEGYLPRK